MSLTVSGTGVKNLFLGENKLRNLALRGGGGGLKIETAEYDHVSRVTQTRERLSWRGRAATENCRPYQTNSVALNPQANYTD
jgi:hypothetical protein